MTISKYWDYLTGCR